MRAPDFQPVAPPTGVRQLLGRARASHGIRAGAWLAVATIVFNVSAYLYNVACIRYLGARTYGDLAAMLALGAVIALPLGSIQGLIAREVAQLPSPAAAGPLLRRASAIAAGLGVALVLIGAALVDPIKSLLNVDSRSIVLAGVAGLFFAVVATVLYGVLQGALRFTALGLIYGISGSARPILVVPALLVGLGAAGALAVNALAGLLAIAIAALALRDLWWREDAVNPPRVDRRQALVMLIGSLAFASLTNVDILLASYFFPNELAGVYAAAALVGKAVLFLPAAVATVLLPKAATRAAAGLTARKILLASAAVTAVLTLAATAVLAAIPESLLVWAFGGDFRESTGLLGWFGLAMSAAALVNIYLSVYFAERDATFPLLVLAAAVAQIVAVSVWHPDARSIILVTLGCCVAVLVAHELFFSHALVRTWRGRGAVAPSG